MRLRKSWPLFAWNWLGVRRALEREQGFTLLGLHISDLDNRQQVMLASHALPLAVTRYSGCGLLL